MLADIAVGPIDELEGAFEHRAKACDNIRPRLGPE
jgi:hypothetical protein